MIRLGQELAVESWLRQGLIDMASEICKKDLKPAEVVAEGPIFVNNEWAHVANMFWLCQKVFKTNSQGYVICCGNYVGPNYSTHACANCGKFWQQDSLAKFVDEVFSVELATARNEPPTPAVVAPSGVSGRASSSNTPAVPS